MFLILLIIIVGGFTFLNRLRGGGFFKTPIDSRLFVAPFVMALAWLAGIHSDFHPQIIEHDLTTGLRRTICNLDCVLFGLGWLFWAYLPWSEWITLGNTPAGSRAPTWFERVINKVSFGNAYVALWLRMFIGLLPIAIMFDYSWMLLSISLLSSYVIGWSIRNLNKKSDPIAIGELLSGFSWGIVLVIISQIK